MHARTNGSNTCKIHLVYLHVQVEEGKKDTIHFQMTIYAGHCGFYLSLALSACQHFAHRPPFPSPTLTFPSLTHIVRPDRYPSKSSCICISSLSYLRERGDPDSPPTKSNIISSALKLSNILNPISMLASLSSHPLNHKYL